MKWTGMLIAGAIVVAIVAGYNTWLFCWGRCTLENFLRLNVPSGLLLASNGVAFAILLLLKARPSKHLVFPRCQCGAELEPQWNFCGRCGELLKKS